MNAPTKPAADEPPRHDSSEGRYVGWRAVRAGMRARRVLMRRRLAAELAQGTGRAVGLFAIGLGIAGCILLAGYAGGFWVVFKGAPELVETFTSAALLFLSGALILSSLGHAAQCFFSSKELWFWDSTPVPPWARFVDRATETAAAAAPTTVALGMFGLLGLMLGASLGAAAMVRAIVAILVVASVPVSIGIFLAHAGGAVLPAGKLRRISFVLLGVSVTAVLVWFRRAGVDKLVTPEGAADLLAAARGTKEVGPHLLPSSLGAQFVISGDAAAFAGMCAWAAGVLALAFLSHRFLSRRARELAVDESPVGILRGSAADRALAFVVRPVRDELKAVVEKDLLAFLRDPAQWGQVILLLGVGVLYLVTASGMRTQLAQMPLASTVLLPGMHTGLVAFIAAGLAVRFAFPQVGLEGPAVWIVDGSPLHPRALLTAKVIASLPVVVVYPTIVCVVGGGVLGLHPALWFASTAICACVALGVAAFGVGRGAVNPLFDATSLSELAIGPGALSTMLLSVMFAFFGSLGAFFAGDAVAAGHRLSTPATVAAVLVSCAVPSLIALFAGRRALDKGAAALVRRREDEAVRQFLTDAPRTVVVDA